MSATDDDESVMDQSNALLYWQILAQRQAWLLSQYQAAFHRLGSTEIQALVTMMSPEVDPRLAVQIAALQQQQQLLWTPIQQLWCSLQPSFPQSFPSTPSSPTSTAPSNSSTASSSDEPSLSDDLDSETSCESEPASTTSTSTSDERDVFVASSKKSNRGGKVAKAASSVSTRKTTVNVVRSTLFQQQMVKNFLRERISIRLFCENNGIATTSLCRWKVKYAPPKTASLET
jgi:hypothetical protein